jgi:predicted CXXCH cytochrome family protein
MKAPAAMLYLYILGAVLWHCDVEAGYAHAKTESRPLMPPHSSLSCWRCHPEGKEASMNNTVKLCIKCHKTSTGKDSHPTGVSCSAETAGDLPLSEDGRIECYTCHIMHKTETAAPKLLRKDFNSLCTSCHSGGTAEHPHSGDSQTESSQEE